MQISTLFSTARTEYLEHQLLTSQKQADHLEDKLGLEVSSHQRQSCQHANYNNQLVEEQIIALKKETELLKAEVSISNFFTFVHC